MPELFLGHPGRSPAAAQFGAEEREQARTRVENS
jgi:hypothetical protein